MLITTMFIQLSEFNFAHGQPTCKALYRVLQNLCNKIPRARRNSGNGGNGGNMIIIIIDYVGDGGNDIQRLDSTVERYFFLHGLAESTRKTTRKT